MKPAIVSLFVAFFLLISNEIFGQKDATDNDSVTTTTIRAIEIPTDSTQSASDRIEEAQKVEKMQEDRAKEADKVTAASKESIKASNAELKAVKAEKNAVRAEHRAIKAQQKAERQQRKAQKAREALQ